ncbi:MAG: hypothetical protein JXR63_08730 [Spirochaetales bacterium]|nr:hypothetical protein [Spirochaetales bacterium]
MPLKKVFSKRFLSTFIVTLVITVLLFLLISSSPFGQAGLQKLVADGEILDVKFGYSPEQAYSLLENLGDEGREFYLKKIIPIDFFFPVAYSFLLFLALYILTKGSSFLRVFRPLIFALPLLTCLFDYFENISVLILLLKYPSQLLILVKFANVMTICKFIALIGSVLLVVAIFLYRYLLLFSRSKSKKLP